MAIEAPTRMERFVNRGGMEPCRRCGGRMEAGWDEHQPVAKCWLCGWERRANPLPPLNTIETFTPEYYADAPRTRLV